MSGAAEPAEGPESRLAYRELFEYMLRLDDEYLAPERRIVLPEDVAEGEHMLLHLLKAALDVWVDNDPGRPRFAPLAGPTLKWGGEGSDNPAYCAPLYVGRRYRIRGSMNDAVYVSFTVYRGKEEGSWSNVVSALNHTEFEVAADGSYEVEIGAEPRPGALHMEPGAANSVVARYYFEREVCAVALPNPGVELEIETLDDPIYPRPLSPATLAQKLRTAVRFLDGWTLGRPPMDPAKAPAWFSMVPNELPQPLQWVPSEGGGAGAVDNAYCAAPFVLAPDQSLLIEGRWPVCVYANVMLWNRYNQGLDYRYRPTSLNRRQMQADAEGRFRVVVAHRDPGVPNWLDTEGRGSGVLYWRFLLPEGEIEQPRCRVVPAGAPI